MKTMFSNENMVLAEQRIRVLFPNLNVEILLKISACLGFEKGPLSTVAPRVTSWHVEGGGGGTYWLSSSSGNKNIPLSFINFNEFYRCLT
jgi:hypothetical protein